MADKPKFEIGGTIFFVEVVVNAYGYGDTRGRIFANWGIVCGISIKSGEFEYRWRRGPVRAGDMIESDLYKTQADVIIAARAAQKAETKRSRNEFESNLKRFKSEFARQEARDA